MLADWLRHTSALTVPVSAAAEILGIGRTTAYESAKRGEIPSLRLGRRLVVPVEGLRAMLGVRFVGQGEVVPNPELGD